MLSTLAAYLRSLARRRTIDLETDEELQFHLDRAIAANLARGMSHAEARRVALAELGGLPQTVERVKEVRSLGIGTWGLDVRYACRSLAATPRFTIVALLTVVLTVAGICTIFTLVHGVLLRPLAYPDSDRLFVIESSQPKSFGTNVALEDVLTFQRGSQSFDAWGLYRPGYATSTYDAKNVPVDLQDQQITPELFRLLNIGVVLGRPLLPEDSRQGAPDVALISHDLWQTLFGGRPDVLNETIRTTSATYTIVGVTGPDADLPRNWLNYPILWRPIRESSNQNVRFAVLARLRSGVALSRARAELAAVAKGLEAARPATHEGRTTVVTPLLDKIVGDYSRILWIFFASVSVVLLIGVANIVSLQIARNGAREREFTLRAALGASRARLVRQLLVESVLLSTAGGVLGFALAFPATALVLSTLPARFPRAAQVGVDWNVAIFACAISLTCGVVIGLVPAWQATRPDLTTRLNEGGRSATLSARRGRVQRMLIAFETAVALVLLIGASLLLNSFHRLITRDAGMQEEDLWVVRATLPARYSETAAQIAFWSSALEQLRQLPGVQSAALVVNSSGPLEGGDISRGGILPEGRTAASDRDGFSFSTRAVSPAYFSTLGMRLLKGRPILDSDVKAGEPVAVINALAAEALWPGQDPIGRRLHSGKQLTTVVGVIPTFLHTRLNAELSPQMYTSYLQHRGFASTSAILLRTSPGSGPAAAAEAVLLGLEKDLSVRTLTMAQARWQLLAAERFRTAVLLTFAITAVLLALVGIFGLVAYTVGQRQREIAIRVALGAIPRHIVHVAIRQAAVPALVGLAVGLAAAGATTRVLAAYLVDIQAIHPPTFGAAVVLLAAAALGAGLLPARRALTVEPVDALRHE